MSKRLSWAAALGLLALGLLLPECAWAAKIGDVAEESSLGQQALRFLSFRDPAVRFAVAGAVLLGISCGLLGCFIVVRKMALVGDTLSHAVLPVFHYYYHLHHHLQQQQKGLDLHRRYDL